MSDNAAPNAGTDAAPAAEPPKRSKVKTLLTVGLCAALAGGGYVLGGRTASAGDVVETVGATIEGDDGPVEVEFDPAWCEELLVEPALGEVIDLPPMNVNLADGHYLRVSVSLGLSDEAEYGGGEGGEGTTFVVAPAQDIVVSTLSGRSLAELASPEGRDEAKHELTELIIAHYGEDVISVFLTEFVMQ